MGQPNPQPIGGTTNDPPDTGGGPSNKPDPAMCAQLKAEIDILNEQIDKLQQYMKDNPHNGPTLPIDEPDPPGSLNWMLKQQSDLQQTYNQQGCALNSDPAKEIPHIDLHSPVFCDATIYGTLYQKWTALATRHLPTGQSVQDYLGAPLISYWDDALRQQGITAQYFERGILVEEISNPGVFVVFGPICGHYRKLGGPAGQLGLPLADPELMPGNSYRSRFEHGDIYQKGSAAPHAIQGPLRAHWQSLGGVTSSLGYPLSDQLSVKDQTGEIGHSQRFEGGVICYRSGEAPHKLDGAILSEWEARGSAAGELGFPVSEETPSSSGSGASYVNFEHGCIVVNESAPYNGVAKTFTSLRLTLKRFQSTETGDFGDLGETPDLYVNASITASTGESFVQTLPASGDFDGPTAEVNQDVLDIPVVRGDLVIEVSLEGMDNESAEGDTHLGLVQGTYWLDNQWGIEDSDGHWSHTFYAEYHFGLGPSAPGTYDPNQFRQSMFWPFKNSSTDKLSWQQMAETFDDVDPDDSLTWDPLHDLKLVPAKIFYELVYKCLAANGYCFGMCLSSIFSQVSGGAYPEAISRFGPTNAKLNPDKPSDQNLINEMDIRHGYEVGAELVAWGAAKYLKGEMRDPMLAYTESKSSYEANDYPILMLHSGSLTDVGHAVRPYKWIPSPQVDGKSIILVANPNNPPPAGDADPRNQIVINAADNTFSFQKVAGDAPWTGSGSSGGLMFSIPFSMVSGRPSTPVWEVGMLLAEGVCLLVGGAGRTKQVTDDVGRTFYEPMSSIPTKWDHIRQDPSARIPNMTRLPLSAGGGISLDANLVDLFYLEGGPKLLSHEIVGTDTGLYTWALHSVPITVVASIPGTTDEDVIEARPDGADQAVTIKVTQAKTVSLAIGGWSGKSFYFDSLSLNAGESITLRLANCGQELQISSSHPKLRLGVAVQGPLANWRPNPATLELLRRAQTPALPNRPEAGARPAAPAAIRQMYVTVHTNRAVSVR